MAKRATGSGELNGVESFTAEYASNRYAVILALWVLSYEMVEIVMPGSVYMPAGEEPWVGVDSEGPREGHLTRIGGGYYAAKLPVYEYLARGASKRSRSSSAKSLRLTGPQLAPGKLGRRLGTR